MWTNNDKVNRRRATCKYRELAPVGRTIVSVQIVASNKNTDGQNCPSYVTACLSTGLLRAYAAAMPLRPISPITFGNTCKPLKMSPQFQTALTWITAPNG